MTTTQQPFQGPAYLESVELLLRLHLLTREGRQDSDEGDAIRAASEAPWYELDDDEQERINGMSADLKTIEPNSPIKHADNDRYISDDFAAKLASLLMARKCDEVLDLLRKLPEQISWDLAAQYRAEAYAKLGEEAVAKRFLAEAWRLNPQLPDLRFVDAGIRGIFLDPASPPSTNHPSTL